MTDLNLALQHVKDSLSLLENADRERDIVSVEKAALRVQEAAEELQGGKVFAPLVLEPLEETLTVLNDMAQERTLNRLEHAFVPLRQAQERLMTLLPPKKVAA